MSRGSPAPRKPRAADDDAWLAIPPTPHSQVERPRLLALLDGSDAHALTIVSAGPGAGKTALLSEWARRSPTPPAWVGLSGVDDRASQFRRRLRAGLRVSGLAEAQLPRLGDDGSVEWHARSSSLEGAALPVTLVLDDAHVLSDPTILRWLDEIARGWSRRMRLVLACRSDPALPLHRYRLDGQLLEIRGDQMVMTADEARQLLANHEVQLSDAAFATLLRRTEGWAAGLTLSALRLTGADNPAAVVAELAFDQGSVGEYLTEEVLECESATVRRLLVETSFAPEISAGLAQAVTGIPNAGALLADLARTNSFVVPLDRAYTRFRLHEMFAEVLRNLLRRRPDQEVHDLMRRAAAWFESEGQLDEAFACYVSAGDEAAAADVLIRGGFITAVLSGRPLSAPDFRRLGANRAGDLGPAGRNAGAARVLTGLWDGSPGDALTRLRAWAVATESLPRDVDLSVTTAVAEIVLARRAGDWPAMSESALAILSDASLLEVVKEVTGLRTWLLAALASAEALQGFDGEDSWSDVLTSLSDDSDPAVAVDVMATLALHHTMMMKLNHADEDLRRVHELLASRPELAAPLAVDLAAAIRAVVLADLSELSTVVDRLIEAGRPDDDASLAAFVALSHADLLVVCGRIGDARAVLRNEPALGAEAIGIVAMCRDIVRAEIETTLGRPNLALRLLDVYTSSHLRDRVAASRARACLAAGNVSLAASVVRAALTAPSCLLNRYELTDTMLCDAQVALSGSDEGRAVDLLTRATEIAAGDIVRPFTRAADVFAGVLARHPLLAAAWPVPSATPTDGGSTIRPALSLADPLTDRERTVLRYLGTNMSTAEIAAELYLSVNTIKTHLAAIYRKLAASRRREAVIRARELELL